MVDPRRRHELITHLMRMSSWSKKLTWRSQEVLRRRSEPKRRTSLQKLSPDMLNLFCTFWRPRLSDWLLWPCVGKLFQRATTFMLTSRANSRRNFREKPMTCPRCNVTRPRCYWRAHAARWKWPRCWTDRRSKIQAGAPALHLARPRRTLKTDSYPILFILLVLIFYYYNYTGC